MIQITKGQMEFIKKHSPATSFTVTNRQSSLGKKKTRYVEETAIVLGLLKKYSEEIQIVKETYGKV